MSEDFKKRLDQDAKRLSDAENKLNYYGSSSPTSSQFNLAKQVDRLRKEATSSKQAYLRDQWYDKRKKNEKADKPSLFSRAIDSFSKPLYAEVGVAKYLTGKGKGGLFKTINQNIFKDKETYGDLLAEHGFDGIAGRGVGLGLDIVLDPTNVLLGEGVLNKAGKGLIEGSKQAGLKAGLEAAGEAFKESGAHAANKMLKFIPKSASKEEVAQIIAKAEAAAEAGSSGVAKRLMKSAAILDKNAGKGELFEKYINLKNALKDGTVKGEKYEKELADLKRANRFNIRGRVSSLYNKTRDIENKAVNRYSELTGRDTIAELPELYGKGTYKKPVEWLKDSIRESDNRAANKIVDFFETNPDKWFAERKGAEMDAFDSLYAFGKEIPPEYIVDIIHKRKTVPEVIDLMEQTLTAEEKAAFKAKNKLPNPVLALTANNEDKAAMKVASDYMDMARGVDEAGNAKNVADNSEDILKELEDIMAQEKEVNSQLAKEATTAPFKINVKPYDAVVDKIANLKYKDAEVGKKFLDALNTLNSTFKAAKVVHNPASYMNAVLGNASFILAQGLDLTPSMLKSINDAHKEIVGKGDGAFFAKLFGDENMARMISENPKAFSGVYGLSKDDIRRRIHAHKLIDRGYSSVKGIAPDELDEVANVIDKIFDENPTLEELLAKKGYNAEDVFADPNGNSAYQIGKTARKAKESGMSDADAYSKGMLKQKQSELQAQKQAKLAELRGQVANQSETIGLGKGKKLNRMPTSWEKLTAKDSENLLRTGSGQATSLVGSELEANPKLMETMSNISSRAAVAKAKTKKDIMDYAAILLDKAINGAPKAYESIDQSYKLGLTNHLVHNGITEKELRRLGKMVEIDPTMVKSKMVDGERKFFFDPYVAMKIASDTFMNYGALPRYAQILRKLPVVGSPFYAFSSLMLPKMGKTAYRNPEFFAKVNNFIHEFSGQADPLEKNALNDKSHEYLNEAGMVRLPFKVDGKTQFLKISNMNPFLSPLSFFQDTNRAYRNKLPNVLATAVDKSPFLKTPSGQFLFNFIVLPALSKRGEIPKGQFGQKLWNKDATTMEKAGFAGRDLISSYIPEFLAPLGALVPEDQINKIPLYRGRQYSGAVRGENALGIRSKGENAYSRLTRTILGSGGVPTYSMDARISNKLNK